MKTIILLFGMFLTVSLLAQSNNMGNIIGNELNTSYQNGLYLQRITTTPIVYDRNYKGNNLLNKTVIPPLNGDNNTAFRWTLTDPVAVINETMTSGTGQYQFVSWYLNNARFSLYGNTNNTPLWEFSTNAAYVSISDSGNYVAGAGQYDIYIFNRANNVPFLTLVP